MSKDFGYVERMWQKRDTHETRGGDETKWCARRTLRTSASRATPDLRGVRLAREDDLLVQAAEVCLLVHRRQCHILRDVRGEFGLPQVEREGLEPPEHGAHRGAKGVPSVRPMVVDYHDFTSRFDHAGRLGDGALAYGKRLLVQQEKDEYPIVTAIGHSQRGRIAMKQRHARSLRQLLLQIAKLDGHDVDHVEARVLRKLIVQPDGEVAVNACDLESFAPRVPADVG